MVEIGTTHNVGSSLRVWLVTLPDQHLTRPCLAECFLAIATWSAVNGVDSPVHAQCVVAFKTYSVKLLSSETLICVFVGSHLRWLVDYVSSWGTTRTDTCILLGNGSVQYVGSEFTSLRHFPEMYQFFVESSVNFSWFYSSSSSANQSRLRSQSKGFFLKFSLTTILGKWYVYCMFFFSNIQTFHNTIQIKLRI